VSRGVIYEGDCCVDCVLLIANGDASDAHAARVEANWPDGGLVLACPDECEGEFSSRECDCCGSRLAGERHPFAVLGQVPS
jgi:hypothetical protein